MLWSQPASRIRTTSARFPSTGPFSGSAGRSARAVRQVVGHRGNDAVAEGEALQRLPARVEIGEIVGRQVERGASEARSELLQRQRADGGEGRVGAGEHPGEGDGGGCDSESSREPSGTGAALEIVR